MDFYYPEWYKVEKQASTIINNLANLEDLLFYLENPNQYIRRQALLRLHQLKPVESINMLEEIINNPLEDYTNKEIAALTIKAISSEHDLGFFNSHKIIEEYTEIEKSCSLKKPEIIEPSQLPGFSLNIPSLCSEWELEEDYLIRDQEVNFQTSFTLKSWFIPYKEHLLSNWLQHIKTLPIFVFNKIKALLKFLWSKFIKKAYLHYRQKINPSEILKSLFFYLLYLLCTPIRMIRNHKKLTVALIMICFFLFNTTSNGKEFISQYLNLNLPIISSSFAQKGFTFLTTVWTEIVNVSNVLLIKIKETTAWNTIHEFFLTAIQFAKGS